MSDTPKLKRFDIVVKKESEPREYFILNGRIFDDTAWYVTALKDIGRHGFSVCQISDTDLAENYEYVFLMPKSAVDVLTKPRGNATPTDNHVYCYGSSIDTFHLDKQTFIREFTPDIHSRIDAGNEAVHGKPLQDAIKEMNHCIGGGPGELKPNFGKEESGSSPCDSHPCCSEYSVGMDKACITVTIPLVPTEYNIDRIINALSALSGKIRTPQPNESESAQS